jgi:hypothetical protein
MRIEAVAVCVNYADYLAETLPFVLPHVDDMVIVTTPDDRRTIGLCHMHGVRCLPTKCFYQWGDKFNKARGINYGLAHLRQSDWILHIDADLALPSRTRWLLNCCCLEPTKIYGIDRVNIKGRAAWEAYKRNPDLQFVSSCRMEPPTQHEFGSRLVHVGHGGYCPIGFWQAWHPGGSGIARYPDTASDTAEHTDVLHAAQWSREDRVLIPEIVGMHLVTSGASKQAMGVNWKGRTSPEFSEEEGPYDPSPYPRPRPKPPHPHPGPHPEPHPKPGPHPHPPVPPRPYC